MEDGYGKIFAESKSTYQEEIYTYEVEAIENFTFTKFNELKNYVRKDMSKDIEGSVCKGDTFECSEEIKDYLMGENQLRKVVIKILKEKTKKKKSSKKKEEK